MLHKALTNSCNHKKLVSDKNFFSFYQTKTSGIVLSFNSWYIFLGVFVLALHIKTNIGSSSKNSVIHHSGLTKLFKYQVLP